MKISLKSRGRSSAETQTFVLLFLCQALLRLIKMKNAWKKRQLRRMRHSRVPFSENEGRLGKIPTFVKQDQRQQCFLRLTSEDISRCVSLRVLIQFSVLILELRLSSNKTQNSKLRKCKLSPTHKNEEDRETTLQCTKITQKV